MQLPTTFGLMRHAKTDWNLEKRIQGQNDTPLAAEGMAQAEKWAKRLKKTSWDRILTSDLGRTRTTAKIIGDHLDLPIVTDSGLGEQDWGKWTGRIIARLRQACPSEITSLENMGWEFRPPGGESRTEVRHRASVALYNAANEWPSERILVITHLGVMKCILYKLLNRGFLPNEKKILKPYHLHKIALRNGSLSMEELNAISL